MIDWKDIIAQRLKDRIERNNQIERIMNRIEVTLESLLVELKVEYSIKTNYKTKYNKENEPSWIITIEDMSVELNSNNLSQYLSNNKDLKESLIEFILDKFTFKDSKLI